MNTPNSHHYLELMRLIWASRGDTFDSSGERPKLKEVFAYHKAHSKSISAFLQGTSVDDIDRLTKEYFARQKEETE